MIYFGDHEELSPVQVIGFMIALLPILPVDSCRFR